MPAPRHGAEMLFTQATVNISPVCPFNRLADVRPYVSTQILPQQPTSLKAQAGESCRLCQPVATNSPLCCTIPAMPSLHLSETLTICVAAQGLDRGGWRSYPWVEGLICRWLTYLPVYSFMSVWITVLKNRTEKLLEMNKLQVRSSKRMCFIFRRTPDVL